MTVWDDVVGQESAVAALQGAVANPAAMTHAWLVTGPPGSGRSVAARAFAAALQCPQGGCGVCRACTTTLAGTHPDVTLLATEKVVIAIDEVRDLIMTASRSPSGGRWRVIIIEDADRMAERTTNVLLKTIEEPPPHTVWVLCAPSVQDVLPTIRSRCRAVVLRVPPPQAVADLLVRRDGADPAVALSAARAAQHLRGTVMFEDWRCHGNAVRQECTGDIAYHRACAGPRMRSAARSPRTPSTFWPDVISADPHRMDAIAERYELIAHPGERFAIERLLTLHGRHEAVRLINQHSEPKRAAEWAVTFGNTKPWIHASIPRRRTIQASIERSRGRT